MYCAMIDDETEREQFIRLYNENRDAMYHFALSVLRDPALAEDALHDAFVRVARNMSKIDFSRNTRALLLTIVKNVSLTMLRKREREIPTEVPELMRNIAPDNEAGVKDALDAVSRVVNEMPEKYTTVFRLRFAHDLTYVQIASLLDISVNTVKKRVQRVRERIMKVMEDNDNE